ncbi:transposase domain-containing protein [Sulfobacillus harzensis]|uniref:transposase domain-containing protein n=1 Tax=Sulfobacillus harzensis TaxID=2729629 RepID=UPI0030846048
MIETAKENGLNPQAYLQYLFEELPHRDLNDLATWQALLPWSSELPDDLKSPAPTRQAQ